MLVAQEATLLELQQYIATLARSLKDPMGQPVTLPTLDATALRMAALIALQVASGQCVIDGSKPLRIVMPKPQPGIIEFVQER